MVRFEDGMTGTVVGTVTEVDEELEKVTVRHEEGEYVLSMDEVCWVREVKCSRRHIDSANLHAMRRFPGARVLPVHRTRSSRINEQRAGAVAAFLRNPENVDVGDASIANSKSGGKLKFKTSRCSMYIKLKHEMLQAGIRPVSSGYFYELTKDYDIVTADNCCCGTCRDLGMYNFNELREVIKELNEHLKEYSHSTAATAKEFDAASKVLIDRCNAQEKFLSTSFFSHLKHNDGCGNHCLTHLLSTYNNPNFKKGCTHPRDDDVVVEPEETMDQYHQREFGRDARPTDWDGECSICEDNDKTQRLQLCKSCNVAVHKDCMEGNCNDLPRKGDMWMCPDCVRDDCNQQHTSSCELCNEFDYLMNDVFRRINLLIHYESIALKDETEETIHQRSDMLACRLRLVQRNEHLFRAHKIRHRNQHCFKELCLNNMGIDSFYLLVDYWAKLQAQKDRTKTCEGGEVG